MSNSALGSQSISLLTLPAGTLIDYAGTVEPSGWMLCDGRQLATAAHPTLFAAIGYSYGGSGANFNIPDFRGRFARYNDNMGTALGAASRDTGRVHGSIQDHQIQNHNHNLPYFSGSPNSCGSTQNYVRNASNDTGASICTFSGTITTMSNPVGSNSGSETRPINLSCNKLIKI